MAKSEKEVSVESVDDHVNMAEDADVYVFAVKADGTAKFVMIPESDIGAVHSNIKLIFEILGMDADVLETHTLQ
jgi:hypothetical protein